MKRFVDEEDDSFDSSTASESESEQSIAGGNDSDGENPYADGTGSPQSPPPQRPTTPLFLVCVLEVACMLWGAVVSVADGELIVDFGDDARSVVTSATQRTSATARTEKTTATASTAKTKKKDVIPPSALPFPSPSHSFCSLVSFVFRVDGGLMIG